MTPTERVDAVLSGRRPDRLPVSFWYHFPAEQAAGPMALQVHLDLLQRFGLDFLKVMNDNPYPASRRIAAVEDLAGATAPATRAPRLENTAWRRLSVAGRTASPLGTRSGIPRAFPPLMRMISRCIP